VSSIADKLVVRSKKGFSIIFDIRTTENEQCLVPTHVFATSRELRRCTVRFPGWQEQPGIVRPRRPGLGSRAPAFHQTKKPATFDDTYNVGAAAASQPTLQIHATNLADSASSTGLGIDSIGTQASSETGSANFVLTDNLSTTLSILGLSLSAKLVHSDSDASYVFGPNPGFLRGDTSFGSLTISGSLIGKLSLCGRRRFKAPP
jgi:hypothetical protein